MPTEPISGHFSPYQPEQADTIEAQPIRRRWVDRAIHRQATAALSIALPARLSELDDNAEFGSTRPPARAAWPSRSIAYPDPIPSLAWGWSACGTPRASVRSAAFGEHQLNPSFAAAHVLLAQMHLYAGRPEYTIAQAKKNEQASAAAQRSALFHRVFRRSPAPINHLRQYAVGDRCRGARVAQPHLAVWFALRRPHLGPLADLRRAPAAPQPNSTG